MKDIKDIFKDRFENFEQAVDPKLWTSIQSGIAGQAAATGGTILSGLAAKVIAAVVVATIAVTSIVWYSSSEQPIENKEVLENNLSEKTTEVEKDAIVLSETTKEEITPSVEPETKVNTSEPAGIQEEDLSDLTPAGGLELDAFETLDDETSDTKEKDQETSPLPIEKPTNSESETPLNETKTQEPVTFQVVQNASEPRKIRFVQQEMEGVRYLWDFGNGMISDEIEVELTYTDFGVYEVNCTAIVASGKESVFTQSVEAVHEPVIIIADSFSPNNDPLDLNSRFNLMQQCEHVTLKFAKILDKNNQVVYNYTEDSEGWDGLNLKGDPCPEGTYLYVALFMDQKGESLKENGKVTLFR